MLSLPNYYRRKASQNMKSGSIWQELNLAVCKQEMGEESQEMMEPHTSSMEMDIDNSPWESTASTGKKKNFKTAKPSILIPTPRPILQKTTIQNDMTLIFNSQGTDPRNGP